MTTQLAVSFTFDLSSGLFHIITYPTYYRYTFKEFSFSLSCSICLFIHYALYEWKFLTSLIFLVRGRIYQSTTTINFHLFYRIYCTYTLLCAAFCGMTYFLLFYFNRSGSSCFVLNMLCDPMLVTGNKHRPILCALIYSLYSPSTILIASSMQLNMDPTLLRFYC